VAVYLPFLALNVNQILCFAADGTDRRFAITIPPVTPGWRILTLPNLALQVLLFGQGNRPLSLWIALKCHAHYLPYQSLSRKMVIA
jgi:hypothetical protein